MFSYSSLAIPWWIHALVGAWQVIVLAAPAALAVGGLRWWARRADPVLLR